jgi:hypothetical protein
MITQEEFGAAKPYIEAALHYNCGTQDLDDVKRQLESGEMQLILGQKSAVVTQISAFPNKTFINIVLAGGDLEELKGIANKIEDASRKAGLDGVIIVGRKGWGKVLDGYKTFATIFMKEN